MNKAILSLVGVFVLGACLAPATGGPTGGPAQLLFASGFEGDVRFGPRVVIDHDGYRAIENRIETVTGHDGTPTRALYNAQAYEDGYTQSPYEILNVKQGRSDLYIRFWMKMDRESLTQNDTWRAIFEYKTKGYGDGNGFRLISYVYTNEQGQAYWHWQGDANPMNPVWEIDNFDVPVPMEEWFLTEYFWHWDTGNAGRALWKINGQVVGDHRGATTLNNQPIDFIILTQIYGDANPKYQWIDDIEIWDGLPEKYFPAP